MEFSDLALQKLLQLFPELGNYIINFKEVTEELNQGEDSDTQVGIFVLAIGGMSFYLPVVGKAGAIQPIDSAFSVEEQKFVPLTKNYVTKMVNSTPLQIGKGTKIPNTVNKSPSVYDLVTPPRTGKFIYASTSRLTEFLASSPSMVKKAFITQFLADPERSAKLHSLLGLGNLVEALREENQASKAPPSTVAQNAVHLLTEGNDLSHQEVQDILQRGYSLRGAQRETRFAVPAIQNDPSSVLCQIGSGALPGEYDVVLRDGETHAAFVPRRSDATTNYKAIDPPGGNEGPLFAIFSNGSYVVGYNAVAKGERRDDYRVLRDLFEYSDPLTPRDIEKGQNFAIFSKDLCLVGAYSCHNVVHSGSGVIISAQNIINHRQMVINALRNGTVINQVNENEIYVPYNAIVALLGTDIGEKLETNINSAQTRQSIINLHLLGDKAVIGHNSGEFTYNGRMVGGPAKIMEILVVHEGIRPDHAENFVKRAEQEKSFAIYLSKRADFGSGTDSAPSFGGTPPEPQDTTGPQLQGNSQQNVDQSLQTNDAQTVEASIITELLQAPDMLEYVREYLPDVKEALDRLGRILFLARLNLSRLFTGDNGSEVFSFISGLRNVYRTLGDNYLKLERLASEQNSNQTDQETV